MSPTQYTGIYRCPDNIKNLKIRIRLKNEETGEETFKIFKWQQKCFSQTEIDYYSNVDNCVTDLENKYHDDVITQTNDNINSQLYCYTKFDEFSLVKSDNVENFGRIEENESKTNESFDFKLSLLSAMKNPLYYSRFEVMYLMADLGEYCENTWIKDEHILCTVKFEEKSRILSIFPDFTKFEPYSKQVERATVQNFTYFIENASKDPIEDISNIENDIINKICKQKRALTDVEFTMPQKTKLQIYLFFEIQSVENFEYENLFVQYFIDLPKNWYCLNTELLNGTTQRCRSRRNSAHFGHVFDLILQYDLSALNKQAIPSFPHIYFEIFSKDYWDRFRTEGLCYKAIPISTPGTHSTQLDCFRPRPNGWFANFRRSFIGDSLNYKDVTWIGIPNEFEDRALNKFGTSTIGTGRLNFRLDIVHQSYAFFDQSPEKMIFDKLKSSNLIKSVEQVLKEFRKVRQKMIQAKSEL